MMLGGSMVALVTPMEPTGALDETSLRRLIETHIAAGTQAISVIGTTGEAPTLTESERKKIIEIAVETASGRVPIIVGTGTYNTMETLYLTEQALELGADACLIVTPYYNRPTQEGLYQHYRTIAESVSIPIILYTVPKRTGCDLSTETIERLTDFPNIIGLKEASGDLAKAREILARVGDRIQLYTGDDASSLAFLLQGGKGTISVTANVAPKEIRKMCEAALAKDIDLAGRLNTQLMPLHKTLFVEANPIPVKWALAELGWIKSGIRLPLTVLSDEYHEVVKDAMQIAGVIGCAH